MPLQLEIHSSDMDMEKKKKDTNNLFKLGFQVFIKIVVF